MQNCGVRRLPLDFRDQYFGCEIELTGINRATAAQTLADLFGTRAEHSGGGYDAYRVKDLDGKEWKIVRDGSIHPECRRRSVLIGETYKVELNSPKLEYGEMEKLQEVVRSLRRAGGIVNDSCGMHVHVDASKHTPQSLKNVLSIMYSKEDILFAALKVNPARMRSPGETATTPTSITRPQGMRGRLWRWSVKKLRAALRSRMCRVFRNRSIIPLCGQLLRKAPAEALI